MPRVALIVGLGLIGGSVGIALRRRGWRVLFSDPNVTVEEARAAMAADAVAAPGATADVTVVATPVDIALELVRRHDDPDALLLTTCSVLGPLRAAWCGVGSFVAGHPMAGSHERGLAAASGELLHDRPWFVDTANPAADEVIRDCGAIREVVDAAEHDRAVAATSHLPQILSTALAAHLADHPELLRYAGTGLQTFLRLAGSSASVWQPVIDANRENISSHAAAVEKIVREMLGGDPSAFEKARRLGR